MVFLVVVFLAGAVEEVAFLERRGDSPSIDLFLSIVYNYNIMAIKLTKKQLAVLNYIEDFVEPFHDITITGSMISNYVKKGLIENPTKKQYYRDQIAYLIFIAFAKSVLSLENIRMLVEMQKKTYGNQRAYDYFCEEFENILQFVFNLKETLDNVGSDVSDEKVMLRNTIVTISHKLYLDQCFVVLEKELREENEH